MSFLAGLTTDDFAQAIARLYPRGRALPRESDTTLARLNAALGDAIFGVHAEGVALLEREADPAYTVELLPDWEAEYGLPDPCTPANPTLQQRRNALLAKIAGIGGQSSAYYIAVAASLGYQISITELQPFRVGRNRMGDNLRSSAWQFVWIVNAPLTTFTRFRAGQSATGEPLATWGNAPLECVIRRIAPAHTAVHFAYHTSGTLDLDIQLDYSGID
ncbi:MAG: putative phage tail protein [Acetobacteraceae bacterium]|nr:putative phage tail protein [Acetobacteraceae bacterium]